MQSTAEQTRRPGVGGLGAAESEILQFGDPDSPYTWPAHRISIAIQIGQPREDILSRGNWEDGAGQRGQVHPHV